MIRQRLPYLFDQLGCVPGGKLCTIALSFSVAWLVEFRHLPFPSCRLQLPHYVYVQSKPSQAQSETSNFVLASYAKAQCKLPPSTLCCMLSMRRGTCSCEFADTINYN